MTTRTARALAAALTIGAVATGAPAAAQESPEPSAASLLGGAAAAGQMPGGGGQALPTGALPVQLPRTNEVIRSSEPRPGEGQLDGKAAEKPLTDLKPGERPPPPPTDFQQLAASSVGALLPIFGQSLFTTGQTNFAPVLDVPPSSDYALGPGDEVLVRGWGQVDIDVRAVVTRDGFVNIPRVGVVPVAGVKFQDLQATLTAAVSRFYRNFELSVSLGRLRSIQIFVVGQAARPGLYTVSSLATMMSALFAAGGPAPTGSMRRVQLRRGEKLVAELDLYDVLLRGDKSGDQRLLSGDVLFVPPTGPVCAIAGRIKTPAVFELKDEKGTLADLISYAGGTTTTADNRTLLLERLEKGKGRLVSDLPWSEAALATPLRDGDVVSVRGTSQRYQNAITLRGTVALPVRTEWRPGLKVSDLIPDRSLLISEAYWGRVAARAFEKNPAEELKKAEARNLEGQTRDRIKTDVENLVDEVNWDYAVIERLDKAAIEPRLIPFNLAKAIIDRDPANDLALEPGDVVTIFSKKDVLVPAERRTYFVRIEGEVAQPGIYQVKPGDTLRQLVERAGGLTRNAYLFGAEFLRESVRKDQQRRLEEVAARAEQDLERSAAERLARALSAEDAVAVRSQLEAQRSAISRLRSLRPAGRMVLELDPAASSSKDLPDLVLEDGDKLLVPLRYATVGVYGAVYNQSNFIYKTGKRVDDYLDQAGGPTRGADTGSIYVLRADGSVFSRRQSGWLSTFGWQVLMPNDSIVVPEDYAPTSWVKELKDWSQIFYQFGLGIAAIKILKG